MDLLPTEKFCLSIDEAAEYSGIGKHRLREIIDENPGLPFVLRNGEQIIIKRQLFEEWALTLSFI